MTYEEEDAALKKEIDSLKTKFKIYKEFSTKTLLQKKEVTICVQFNGKFWQKQQNQMVYMTVLKIATRICNTEYYEPNIPV